MGTVSELRFYTWEKDYMRYGTYSGSAMMPVAQLCPVVGGRLDYGTENLSSGGGAPAHTSPPFEERWKLYETPEDVALVLSLGGRI